MTEDGKLKHSGYLATPSLTWNPEVLSSYWKQFRYKKWDFYAIYSQNLTLCVAIADLSYIKNVFLTIYEENSEPHTYEKLILPWENLEMSSTSESGTSQYNSTSFLVQFKNIDRNYKSVIAQHDKIALNLQFKKSSNQEGMVYLGPFNEDMSQFFYSHKQYNYKVSGYVKIGDSEHIIYDELGIMDWGRGVWPYHGGWIWGSGQGFSGGKNFGINIGELPKSSKSAEASDDCVTVDEKMIKLGIVIVDEPETDSPVWRFHTVNDSPNSRYASAIGNFTANKTFKKSVNLWAIKSELNQYFGEYSAEVTTVDGVFSFKAKGILEVHYSRW